MNYVVFYVTQIDKNITERPRSCRKCQIEALKLLTEELPNYDEFQVLDQR